MCSNMKNVHYNVPVVSTKPEHARDIETMSDAVVHASHILLKDRDTCEHLYRDILDGTISFVEAAQKHSLCPSGAKAGDLGSFKRGVMIQEFTDVVFDEKVPLHTPQSCFATPFGYHIVQLLKRDQS